MTSGACSTLITCAGAVSLAALMSSCKSALVMPPPIGDLKVPSPFFFAA